MIFKDFQPTHIEFRHWENDVWYYYGVSELFNELIEGECIPQYELNFTLTPDKTTYKFKRV